MTWMFFSYVRSLLSSDISIVWKMEWIYLSILCLKNNIFLILWYLREYMEGIRQTYAWEVVYHPMFCEEHTW